MRKHLRPLRNWSRSLLALALLGARVALLSGCASGEAPPSSPPAPPAAAPPAAAQASAPTPEPSALVVKAAESAQPPGLTPVASASADAPSPSASATAAAPPAGPCPPDMVDTRRACIDRFEAPNVEGQAPQTMVTAFEAEQWCKDQGKRLCSEDEWDRACEGPKHLPYPYGSRYKEGLCNDDKKYIVPSWAKLGTWPSDAAKAEAARLDQREPSGKRPTCVSAEGVNDLTGNVAEWVKRTRSNPTNHDHVVKGCFWGKCFRVPHEPACEYVNYGHPSGFRSYELGFRCCKDRAAEKK